MLHAATPANRGVFVGAASVACGVLVGLALGAVVPKPGEWAELAIPLLPALRCLEPVKDMGRIWDTDALKVPFDLVNDDPHHSLDISVRGSCACTSIEPARLTLVARGKRTVTALMNLEAYRNPSTETWQVQERLIATARDSAGETRVLEMSVVAAVQPSFAIEPEVLRFGQIIKGDTPTREAKILSLHPSPVGALHVLSAPEGFDVALQPLTDEPGAFRLTARARPDVPYGPLNGRVRFRAMFEAGVVLTRSVGVKCNVVDDLFALPSSVAFSAMPLDAWGQEAIVTLQSRRGDEFSIGDAQVLGDGLAVWLGEAPSPSAAAYKVVFTPRKPGRFDGAVEFQARAESGRTTTVRVPVSAYVTSCGAD